MSKVTTKYGIKVMPKKDVLDSQGRATELVLSKAGFSLDECKVGKYIEIETASTKEDLMKMAEYVLYNPLVEEISITEA
ncbi:MAG: phosphoribosylformylglycinamidine synthase subunit PurS [Bdellovibrionales bacterium]